MAEAVNDSRFRFGDLWPALILLLVLLVGLVAAVLTPTGENDQYVVVVAPWSDLNTTLKSIQEANGRMVSVAMNFTTIITVYSDNKNFATQLHSAGEWLVFDPDQLAGCLGYKQRAV